MGAGHHVVIPAGAGADVQAGVRAGDHALRSGGGGRGTWRGGTGGSCAGCGGVGGRGVGLGGVGRGAAGSDDVILGDIADAAAVIADLIPAVLLPQDGDLGAVGEGGHHAVLLAGAGADAQSAAGVDGALDLIGLNGLRRRGVVRGTHVRPGLLAGRGGAGVLAGVALAGVALTAAGRAGAGLLSAAQEGRTDEPEHDKQGADNQDQGDNQPHHLDGVDGPAVAAAPGVGHPLAADAAPPGPLVAEGTALVGDGVVLAAVLAADHIHSPGGGLAAVDAVAGGGPALRGVSGLPLTAASGGLTALRSVSGPALTAVSGGLAALRGVSGPAFAAASGGLAALRGVSGPALAALSGSRAAGVPGWGRAALPVAAGIGSLSVCHCCSSKYR